MIRRASKRCPCRPARCSASRARWGENFPHRRWPGIGAPQQPQGGHPRPGSVFGEMALLDHRPRSATVTSETEMSLLVLGQRQFNAVLEAVPGLAASCWSPWPSACARQTRRRWPPSAAPSPARARPGGHPRASATWDAPARRRCSIPRLDTEVPTAARVAQLVGSPSAPGARRHRRRRGDGIVRLPPLRAELLGGRGHHCPGVRSSWVRSSTPSDPSPGCHVNPG